MKRLLIGLLLLVSCAISTQSFARPAGILGYAGTIYYMQMDTNGVWRGPYSLTVSGNSFRECEDKLAYERGQIAPSSPLSNRREHHVEHCALLFTEFGLPDLPVIFEPIFPPPCTQCFEILLGDRLKEIFPNYESQVRALVEKYQIKEFYQNLQMLYGTYNIESFATELNGLQQKEIEMFNKANAPAQ
jgi:hypothetical protein